MHSLRLNYRFGYSIFKRKPKVGDRVFLPLTSVQKAGVVIEVVKGYYESDKSLVLQLISGKKQTVKADSVALLDEYMVSIEEDMLEASSVIQDVKALEQKLLTKENHGRANDTEG